MLSISQKQLSNRSSRSPSEAVVRSGPGASESGESRVTLFSALVHF